MLVAVRSFWLTSIRTGDVALVGILYLDDERSRHDFQDIPVGQVVHVAVRRLHKAAENVTLGDLAFKRLLLIHEYIHVRSR